MGKEANNSECYYAKHLKRIISVIENKDLFKNINQFNHE